MNKIRMTVYLPADVYALLQAIRIKRLKDKSMPKQSDIISEAIKKLGE